jgi:atypical dual specificity phosphatase
MQEAIRLAHAKRNEIPCGFSWVEDEKIGGMRCPSEEQQLLDLHALFDYGLVVSLTEHPLSFDLTEISKKAKIIHIPVTDFSVPKMQQMEIFLSEVVQQTKPIVVHCHAGMGRTGTIIACYLCMVKKMNPTDAIALVRKKRPGSIETHSQQEFVEECYQYFLNKPLTPLQ